MNTQLNRRNFILTSTLSLTLSSAWSQNTKVNVRFGMVTDPHYADREPNGTRFYRESLQKMQECVDVMNGSNTDFLIELGDLKDENSPSNEMETLRFLDTIEGVFQKYNGPSYHVFGNHDLDSISKEQFLSRVINTGIEKDKSYYSFQHGGVKFIVLDACFKKDGSPYDHGNFDWTDTNISPEQLQWLRDELDQSTMPVTVFVHQLLCGSGNVYIKNAEAVRKVLEDSKKVLAVFHGHHHVGDYQFINGIHYYTLKAVVEGSGYDNNSYAIVNINADGIKIEGYRKAVSKQLELD
jgi:predicted phosphodiesterase